MTLTEFKLLAEEYNQQTRFHSLRGPMQNAPAYSKLVQYETEIIPWIIGQFEHHLEVPNENPMCWGMHWILVLEDIAGEIAIQETILPGNFVAYNVDTTCKAWIVWFYKSRECF